MEPVTYRMLPAGLITAAQGVPPVANGDPGAGVSAPLIALMVLAETLLEPRLVSYTNLPV